MYNNNQTLLDVYDIRVVEDCKGKRKNKNLKFTIDKHIHVRMSSHQEIMVGSS